MVSLLTYVLRALGESNDSYGDALASSSLRILQDCPANVIGARRVNPCPLHFRCFLTVVVQELMLALRHLVLSHHKLALLPHIDKLSDERVLLGTGVGSRELLRFVPC
jgi:transformation/transcription domain-associated protein